MQLVLGGIVLALTIAWCIGAGSAFYDAGDRMIVFHPLVFLFLPYGACLGIAAVFGLALRKRLFAALAALACAAVVVVSSQGYRIQCWAWERSIAAYDAGNREGIRTAAAFPELTDESLAGGISNDEALPVLGGFRWYCEHYIAAPGGAFRAFLYRGLVHVRIQKVRHGWRGVALAGPASELPQLPANAALRYERHLGSGWALWRSE